MKCRLTMFALLALLASCAPAPEQAQPVAQQADTTAADAEAIRGLIDEFHDAFESGDVDRMIEFVETLGIVFWEVFSLVPVGRGTALQSLTAQQHEDLVGLVVALHFGEVFRRQGVDVVEEGHPPAGIIDEGPEARPLVGVDLQQVRRNRGHLATTLTSLPGT